jgi:hypothetical protein
MLLVKKDDIERMQKICKKYVKITSKLDTSEVSERKTNLKCEAMKAYYRRHSENFDHF